MPSSEDFEIRNQDFEIRNQRFILIMFIFLIVFSVIFAVGYTIRMTVDLSAKPIEWCVIIAPAILLLLAVAGIICCYKVKFIFKDNTFMYKEPFKKPKSANAENISCVNVHKGIKVHEVIFIDKKGKAVLSFTDDGTVIICKAFTNTLNRLNIPINYI